MKLIKKMNNEKIGMIWGNPEWSKWLKNCVLIKTEKGFIDLTIFLMNAIWEENKDWICFVMLNFLVIKEEEKIRLLEIFFLMRRREFNYSDDELKKNFSKEIEEWKEVEKCLEKEWENFANKKEIYSRRLIWGKENMNFTSFSLSFEKYKFKMKNGKKEKWKEWEILSKVSFTYNYNLLSKIICEALSHFDGKEPKKLEEVINTEDDKFLISFDIEQEKVPDILITSEKDGKKAGIEVTEVFPFPKDENGSLGIFLRKQIEKETKRSREKHGKIKPEVINSIKIKGLGEGEIKEEDLYYLILWHFSEETNNFDHLINQLKETIKSKNDKWRKKAEEKKWEGMKNIALWTVLQATFLVDVKIPKEIKLSLLETKKIHELHSKFLYLFLLEKIYKKLTKIEFKIDFGYLIITFLNHNYIDKGSFLDSHDPLYVARRGRATEKMMIKLKENKKYIIPRLIPQSDVPWHAFVEVAIPDFYIPIINYKIKNLNSHIEEKKKEFKEEFGLGFSSIECQEIPTCFYLKVNKNFFCII